MPEPEQCDVYIQMMCSHVADHPVGDHHFRPGRWSQPDMACGRIIKSRCVLYTPHPDRPHQPETWKEA